MNKLILSAAAQLDLVDMSNHSSPHISSFTLRRAERTLAISFGFGTTLLEHCPRKKQHNESLLGVVQY